MVLFRLTVEPLPRWLDVPRLFALAPPELDQAERVALDAGHERWILTLTGERAAQIDARLRGLGFDGRALSVRCEPPLSRGRVREARLSEARARRDHTPGFTRSGARASGEGRYSLTPEALALELAQLAVREFGPNLRVTDACCGSGGNAIGFARAGCQVLACELDADRLAEARHNAAVYGVTRRVTFVHGDAREIAEQKTDLLFVDPPWGEHYDKRATRQADFPLLAQLLEHARLDARELWLKLPSSFEVASVPGARASAWFGLAPGDFARVKFVLLRSRP